MRLVLPYDVAGVNSRKNIFLRYFWKNDGENEFKFFSAVFVKTVDKIIVSGLHTCTIVLRSSQLMQCN